MDIRELLTRTANEIVSEIRTSKKTINHRVNLEQYEPAQHDIHDATKRRPKTITTDRGTEIRDVARLSLPFQKIIVDRAAAFLIGEGLDLQAQPDGDTQQRMMDMMWRTWHDNKLDYKTRQMARIWMSETEVAELWYFDEKPELWDGMNISPGGKQRMRMQVLAYSLGDHIYPYFDEYGDMMAFGRGYKVNKREYFDVYTAEEIIKYEYKDGWQEYERSVNLLGKIPVVYYTKEQPEWADVQPLIDRYEAMLSNFADANDYFASPMVKVRGQVKGFAEKGEQGKIITMEENADASYLTWDQAPTAIQLEKETLQELIYSMTQTPDISFKQMQGIGNLSGIALKMMFLDAKLKTFKHQEEFGEGIQRRVNLIKAGMALISTSVDGATSMHVEPKFNFYLPENETETINMLMAATGNRAVMSRKTAVGLNPLVLDEIKEMENINEDDAGQFGNLFDGV